MIQTKLLKQRKTSSRAWKNQKEEQVKHRPQHPVTSHTRHNQRLEEHISIKRKAPRGILDRTGLSYCTKRKKEKLKREQGGYMYSDMVK
jgi:hypothetical protein